MGISIGAIIANGIGMFLFTIIMMAIFCSVLGNM